MRSAKTVWPARQAGMQPPGSENSGAGWRWMFRCGAAGGKDAAVGMSGDCPTRRSRKLARVEAVLLVADGAMSLRKLAQFATLADVAEARQLVTELNDAYDTTGSAFRIDQVASGYRLMTRPQFALWLDRLHNRQARAKLTPPMLETLSIVACQQPVTRAEVEKIRGVQSSEMLKQLMDRGLARITGEDDSLGRPFLYGTTRQFLEEFGLGSLNDLPVDASLRRTRERDEPKLQIADDSQPDKALVQEVDTDADADAARASEDAA